MVVFDTSIMLLTIHPDVKSPVDPDTGKEIEYAKERVEALIEQLEKEKTKIIIPAPSLSELLVKAGEDAPTIINKLQKSSTFEIKPFDTLAAIEASIITRSAISNGDKRGGVDCSWAKVNFDRQIIAIAKVNGANTIYSDDKHIHAHINGDKITAIGLIDLPIPTKSIQGELFEAQGHELEAVLEHEDTEDKEKAASADNQ